jgi:hypothetical protein
MSIKPKLFGNGRPLPSVIENPFDIENIEGIHIFYGKSFGESYFEGNDLSVYLLRL